MSQRRRTAVLVLIAVVFLGVGGAAWSQLRALSTPATPFETATPSRSAAASADPAPTTPAEVLREWDRRRSRAYAAGDLDALGALYIDGSDTGRRDVRLLDRYLRRGLTVQGMSTQVLDLRVVRGRADEDLLLLRVSDRVTGAVATGDATRVRLPTSAAGARLIRLERRDGRWLVSEVQDVVPE